MESLLGIVIFYHYVQHKEYDYRTHDWVPVKGDWYEEMTPFKVERNGKPLKLLSNETSRSVWTDEEIVVKVDRSIPQANGEANVWLKVEEADKQFFAPMLECGDGYCVQEYIPLARGRDMENVWLYDSTTEFYEAASALFLKYDLMWDFHPGQYAVDKRTGLLCIHDYCGDDNTESRFSTLRIGKVA